MKSSKLRAGTLPRSSYLPYPELVEPRPHEGPWAIADSNDQDWLPTNGATDISGKRLFVPLEAGAEGVALHENAHVRWSPVRFPRVRYPLICLQAVEDARINLGLRKIGLPFTLDREQRAYVAHLAAKDIKAGEYASTILRAIASLGTDAGELMREEVEALPGWTAELAERWLVTVERRFTGSAARAKGPVAPFWVARYLARRLAADLEVNGLLDHDTKVPAFGCCHVAGPGEEDAAAEAGDWRGLTPYQRMLRRNRDRPDRAGHPPGRMRIVQPPLTIRQPSVLRAGPTRSRCSSEGSRIVRPDRLVIDRAIFGRGGGGGGTVLVDTSGSMSLSAEQVEAIMRAAGGGATVAMYSGSGDAGELRIIARGDRRVTNDHLEPYASGNIVDLPALQWLARQPEPRWWVSDGCVTGVGDTGSAQIHDRCLEVARRARIRRVEDPDAALEALEA